MVKNKRQVKSLHNVSTLTTKEGYTKLKMLADEGGVKMAGYVTGLIDREWSGYVQRLAVENPERLKALAIVYGLESFITKELQDDDGELE